MGSQVLSPRKLASQMLPSPGGHLPSVPSLPPHLLVLGGGAERAMGRKGLPDDLAPTLPSFHPASTLSPTHRSRANPKSPIQSQPTEGETDGERGSFPGPQGELGVGLRPFNPWLECSSRKGPHDSPAPPAPGESGAHPRSQSEE